MQDAALCSFGISGCLCAYAPRRYHCRMQHNNNLPPELERYLALCRRVYERMLEAGEWPWEDSPDFDDVVESADNQNDV